MNDDLDQAGLQTYRRYYREYLRCAGKSEEDADLISAQFSSVEDFRTSPSYPIIMGGINKSITFLASLNR